MVVVACCVLLVDCYLVPVANKIWELHLRESYTELGLNRR